MKAVRVTEYGGPEVMSYEDVDIPSPGEHDALVKIVASGINYIDTYQRSGLYQIPIPATLGLEAAGTVEATGAKVTKFKTGDRVAYTSVPGAYAEYAVVPEEKLISLPEEVSFNEGAAAMLQGCTAHYLCRSTYPVKKGDRCLVHATAGGSGPFIDSNDQKLWWLRNWHSFNRRQSHPSERGWRRRGHSLLATRF